MPNDQPTDDRVTWNYTPEEREGLTKVLERIKRDHPHPDKLTSDALLSLELDIIAVHANGQPLDFAKWLAFEPFSFWHDVYGIRDHINRKTGRLSGRFLPRCAILKPRNHE